MADADEIWQSPFRPPEIYTVLAVDAMYFHAARQAHAKGVASMRRINRAQGRASRQQERIDAWNRSFEEGLVDRFVHVEKVEPLAIQMDGLEHDLGAAHGILLSNVGTVHILSVAALEAHINMRGEDFFASGRLLEAFERLSLDAKWLLFPRLRGLTGFDTGSEPFQGFDRLIKFRNRLVHYKTRRELWHGGAAPPQFLLDLGLTIEASAQSLAAVEGMTAELARQLGESPPSWVDREDTNFFRLDLERSERETP
jgi:hypothetical protein